MYWICIDSRYVSQYLCLRMYYIIGVIKKLWFANNIILQVNNKCWIKLKSGLIVAFIYSYKANEFLSRYKVKSYAG